MALSFDNNNNNNQSSFNKSGLSFGSSGASAPATSGNKPKFEGNLIGNAQEDILSIGAGITSLVGAIFGYDKEARRAIGLTIQEFKDSPNKLKYLGDTVLSTYNTTIDDFGRLPLGEILGNVAAGAWKHPITAWMDVASLGELTGVTKGIKSTFKKNIKKASDFDTRINLAGEALNETILNHRLGKEFVNQVEKIDTRIKIRS